MPRDILIMTSDVDGIRQLKVDANACELRLPGLPGLRLGLADLEFLASYLPMIAEAAFARASVPPLFPEEDTAGAVRQDAAKGAVPRAQDRRCTPSEDQDCEVIENESPAPDRAAGDGKAGDSKAGDSKAGDSKAGDSKAGKRWTDEEEARLRQRLLDGLSIPEVAAILKRSPGSVIARALLRGMIAVNVTPELVEQGEQQADRGSETGSERRAA